MPKLPAVRPCELIQFLERHGFVLDRVSGSHFIYYHPTTRRRAVAQSYRVIIATYQKELSCPSYAKPGLREMI